MSCAAPPSVASPQFLLTFLPPRSQFWLHHNNNIRTPFAISYIKSVRANPKTCLLADALDWRLAEMEARLELQPSQAPHRACLQGPPLKPHAQVHLLSPIDKCKVSASHLSLLRCLLTKRMLRCATSRQRSMFTTVPCPASPAEHSSGEHPPSTQAVVVSIAPDTEQCRVVTKYHLKLYLLPSSPPPPSCPKLQKACALLFDR